MAKQTQYEKFTSRQLREGRVKPVLPKSGDAAGYQPTTKTAKQVERESERKLGKQGGGQPA